MYLTWLTFDYEKLQHLRGTWTILHSRYHQHDPWDGCVGTWSTIRLLQGHNHQKVLQGVCYGEFAYIWVCAPLWPYQRWAIQTIRIILYWEWHPRVGSPILKKLLTIFGGTKNLYYIYSMKNTHTIQYGLRDVVRLCKLSKEDRAILSVVSLIFMACLTLIFFV